MSTGSSIRVGRVEVPIQTAVDWVVEYTNGGRLDQPYAYPAYDHFDGGTSKPDRLTDADLLAPVLLNVQVKIRSFYDLQGVRGRLEAALANPALAVPLADTDNEEAVRQMVTPLYDVLDKDKPWHVRATTLSKILHRKRPRSVVLHDRWVRACYVGDDAPVPRVDQRSWVDYMVLVTNAIRNDLRSQPEGFRSLEEAIGGPGVLSRVRILDILAWRSRGDAPAAAPDEADGGTSGPGPQGWVRCQPTARNSV